MKRSIRMSFCLQAATTLNDEDLSALTEGIEAYISAGATTRKAEELAITDVLAQLQADRSEMERLIRAQHPELFVRSASSPASNPSEAQGAATKPRTPSGGRNLRKSLQANDPFRALLGEFGLNLELRSDFAPSVIEQRKAMAMGYGPIFRRGGLSLDVAAQYAQERGFLAPKGEAIATEMYDLVKSMMRGEKIAPQFTGDFETRMRAEADRQFDDSQGSAAPVNDYPGWSDEDVAEAEAERAAIMASSDLTPAAAADYPDDAPWNFASTASTEEAMRSLGFNEQEITDGLAQEAANKRAKSRDAGGGDDGAQAAQEASRTRSSEARNQPEDGQETGLTSPTAEGLAAADKRARNAEAADAREQKRLADKARADAQRDEFTLTGSDRPADVAAAAGQGDIFSAQPEPASPSAEPAQSVAAPRTLKPASRIEDFGERIEGARKDYAALLRDAMDVDVATEPMSKSWPEPDYQKLLDGGADPFVVAWVHAARDEVPTKPQSSWKLKGWAEGLTSLRETSRSLLNGEVAPDKAKAAAEKAGPAVRAVLGRAELYQLVGHGQSLKGVTLQRHHYHLYRGEKDVSKWAIEQKAKATAFSNWPREIAVADTKDEVLTIFKEKISTLDLGKKAKGQSSQFVIYRKRGQTGAWVGKKIGREYIDLHQTADITEARAYLTDNTAALEAKLVRYRETPFERRDENQPRVGDDHRNSAPVTPEVFADTFGFRGVQFGNYVEQGRRQSDLNEAFDGLMDMAAVLGVPPRALSLNGRLGLAFGARGKGGKNAAAAHFEPGNVVINLTKGGGPGSLAHEWWHAVDNYFARQSVEGSTDMVTAGAVVDRLRPQMQGAYKSVRIATQAPTLRRRAAELDKRRSKAYWNTTEELSARAFESYVIAKLEDQGASNDYLANVVDEGVWKTDEASRAEFLGGSEAETYPYPGQAELPAVRAAFDDFFKIVETRTDDAGNVAMFSRSGTERGIISIKQIGPKWAVIRNQGTGNEQHLGYHDSEAAASEQASTERATAKRSAGKGAAWWVENSTQPIRPAGRSQLDGLGRSLATTATLDARRASIKTVEQGLRLKQVEGRAGFCFKLAAEASANDVGAMVIGEATSDGETVWHAVVVRDGLIYDPTFARWFEPGVYERLGFTPRLTLSPEQVRDHISNTGGFAPDARNQGLLDGGAPTLSRASESAARAAARRISEGGVQSRDDLQDMLREPGYSQWSESAIVGDVAATRALRNELEREFGLDWRAPKLTQQGVVSFHVGWAKENSGRIEAALEIAKQAGAPAAMRGRAARDSALQSQLSKLGMLPYRGMQEFGQGRLASEVGFTMIAPAGGVTASTPLFSRATEFNDFSRIGTKIAAMGYNPGKVENLQASRKLAALVKRLEEGKITEEQFTLSVRVLAGQMSDVSMTKAANRLMKDRERGADIVRERLIRARRQGDVSPGVVDFALWAIDKNESLADNLGISVRAPKDDVAAGDYNPAAEIIRIFKVSDKDGVAVHEIMHHAERMMPSDMQAAIRQEWSASMAMAIKKGTPEQVVALRLVVDALAGDKIAYQGIVRAIRQGPLNYDDHYQLVNPSEFWAVNATRLLQRRFDARGSIWRRIHAYLSEMVQKARGLLGLRSDAPILKALDYLLDAKNFGPDRSGRFESGGMLSDVRALLTKDGRLPDIKKEKAAEEMPLFSRDIDAPAALNTPAVRKAKSPWLDTLGRPQFAPGAWAYSKIAPVITDRLLTPLKLNAMPKELRGQLRAMKQQIEQAKEVAVKVAAEGFKLSEADRALVSDIIEGEVAIGAVPPVHAARMAAGINAIMDQQTNDLVSVGMLSPDAAERWRGAYLPRFYRSKLAQTLREGGADLWALATRKAMNKPAVMRGMKGDSLKGRGKWQTVPADELSNWTDLGWEVRDPTYEPGASADVQVWRDFSREERDKMGEIRDAGFRFTMGYLRTQRDIAMGRMFAGIAADRSLSAVDGRQPDGWVQVPDGSIPGTGGVKRYGKLAGMWVSKDVMNHLENHDQGASEAMRLYRKALGMWKEGKVVLNPVSHANNVMGNVSMAHFAGVSYWDAHKYAGAITDIVRGAPMIQEAKDAGLFMGTMTQEELLSTMPKELRAMAAMQASKTEVAADWVWNALSLWLRRPAGKMYEAEDLFFRYLIYRDARGRGLAPADAVDYSQRYVFTYDDLPKGAQMIRDFGIPFFAYIYKAIPAMLHTAAHYPHRMLAPAGLMWGLNSLMYALAAGEDDEDWFDKIMAYIDDPERRAKADGIESNERENLPPWMKGSSSVLGTPKAVRLGTDDVTGLPLFWDIAQIMPGGNLFDVENNTGGVGWPQALMPSHPAFTTMAAMFWNKDTLFGKEIVDTNDTSGEAFKKRAVWLWKQFTPAIAIGNYHTERLANVVAQMTGKPVYWLPRDATGVGKDGLPVQLKLAALQTIGIKVRPIDTDLSAQINSGQKAKLTRDIDAEMRRLQRLANKGALSGRNLDAEEELAVEKKRRLREGLTVDGDAQE